MTVLYPAENELFDLKPHPTREEQHHKELQKYWHHQTSVSKEEMNPGLPRSCLGLIGLAGHDEMQSMTSAAL